MWKFSPVIIQDRNPNAPFPPPALYPSSHDLYASRPSIQLTTYYPSVIHQRQEITADPLTQSIAIVYWFIILVAISLPVSTIALVIFIIVSPVAAFLPLCKHINEFLLKIAHFPTVCARNLVKAKTPGCIF